MTESKFKVGQILFVLMMDDRKVIPVQVVEEVKRKTLQGETTDYLVIQSEDGKKINLEKLQERRRIDLFTSTHDLREAMIENANRAIRAIIDNAVSMSHEKFGEGPDEGDDIFADDLEEEAPKQEKPKPKTRSRKKRKGKKDPDSSKDESETATVEDPGIVLENGTRIGKITLPPELEDLVPG